MKTLTLRQEVVGREISVYRASTPNCYANEKVMLTDLRGKELGEARILRIERVSLWDKSNYNVPKITGLDAKLAGFKNIGHMRRIFDNRNSLVPLYKITVRRESV